MSQGGSMISEHSNYLNLSLIQKNSLVSGVIPFGSFLQANQIYTQEDFFALAYVNFPKNKVRLCGRILTLSEARKMLEELPKD
jgi:hypothetical protein